MGAKSHVLDLVNYNPNHSDWYPGKHSQAYRDNFERIFNKKELNVKKPLETQSSLRAIPLSPLFGRGRILPSACLFHT
jgi:hypothetical protein